MGSLVEVIPEINFVYVLKSRQFLFNIVLGHFSGLNKFFHGGLNNIVYFGCSVICSSDTGILTFFTNLIYLSCSFRNYKGDVKFVNKFIHFAKWRNDQHKNCRSWEVIQLCSSKLFDLNLFRASNFDLKFSLSSVFFWHSAKKVFVEYKKTLGKEGFLPSLLSVKKTLGKEPSLSSIFFLIM